MSDKIRAQLKAQPSQASAAYTPLLKKPDRQERQARPDFALRRALTAHAPALTTDDLVSLHQTFGNRAVRQLLSSSAEGRTSPAQAVSPPLSQPESGRAVQLKSSNETSAQVIQRQLDEEDETEEDLEDEEDAGELQLKPHAQRGGGGDGGGSASNIKSRVSALSSRGVPLGESMRARMEDSFGADFGGVRVHHDGEADALNRDLHARAFTTGQNIFFRRGEYDPQSSEGGKLLAHELAHVVQQRAGKVRATAQTKGLSLNDDSALEREADALGERAMRGEIRADDGAALLSASPSNAPVQRVTHKTKKKTTKGGKKGPKKTAFKAKHKKGGNIKVSKAALKKWYSAKSKDPLKGYVVDEDTSGSGKLIRNDQEMAANEVFFDSLNADGYGQGMSAYITDYNHLPVGSSPSVVPPWYPPPNTPWWTSYMVQGHLLNDNIGGPGNDMRNLAPITKKANADHKVDAEEVAKNLVIHKGSPLVYNVNVIPGPPPATDFPTFPMATFNAEFQKLPKGFQCELWTIDQEGAPDQLLHQQTVVNKES